MKRFTFALLAIFLASTGCTIGNPNAIQGSGNIITQPYEVGGFEQVELNTVGDVQIEQGDLQTSRTKVNVQASGNDTVWVLQSWEVTISGSGDVRYYNDPTVTQSLAASGTLRPLGDK